MERYNWTAIPEEKMNPLLSRRVIHTGQLTIAQLWLGKGSVVPLHNHVNQQVTMLQSGALEFEMNAERFVPDLFGPDPSRFLFRTGDSVRLIDGNQLEFFGNNLVFGALRRASEGTNAGSGTQLVSRTPQAHHRTVGLV